MKPSAGRVLISGASIAGPTVGYWLTRYGFEVDIVEQSSFIRIGGYPIDIRGSAIGIVERMGLLPQVRERSFEGRAMTMLDKDGEMLVVDKADRIMSSVTGFDVEIPRGDLSTLLYDASAEAGCRYRFNDRIETLNQDDLKVQVTLASGSTAEYDYVIGADGTHSATRELIFGDEAPFIHHLGYCFVAFSMPNSFRLKNEAFMISTVGKMAGLIHNPGEDRASGIFTIADETIGVRELWDPERRLAIVEERFNDLGWHVPQMIEYMKHAGDVFADLVCQVRIPTWSKGRVVLVGDAAHAPSFITGQGSSLALTSAYILAGELASQRDDPAGALAAYEREARPFAEKNQELTGKGRWQIIPANGAIEKIRNEYLRENGIPQSKFDDLQKVYCSLNTKDYLSLINSARI